MSDALRILESIKLPNISGDPEIMANRTYSVLPNAANLARQILERQYGPDVAEQTDRIVKPETYIHDTGAEVVHLARLREERDQRLAEIRRQVWAA
ncbi:MAG: hypothetical protein AAB462_01710 [Patescibacteria group bacterium]